VFSWLFLFQVDGIFDASAHWVSRQSDRHVYCIKNLKVKQYGAGYGFQKMTTRQQRLLASHFWSVARARCRHFIGHGRNWKSTEGLAVLCQEKEKRVYEGLGEESVAKVPETDPV
jgi:hypothetical protein